MSQRADLLALPPTVDEQQAIVAHIKTESAPLDDAIARTEEEIKLIREYRDRLIADAVTGQVDLRGWSKRRSCPWKPSRGTSDWLRGTLKHSLDCPKATSRARPMSLSLRD